MEYSRASALENKVKLTVNYQKGVLNLPLSAVEYASRATKKDLAVLLAVASEPMAASDLDGCRERIAAAAGVKDEELTASLAFWRGAGVYVIDGEDADADADVASAVTAERSETKPKPRSEKKLPERTLPELTADDVKNITANSPERLTLIDACQETMGRMFNTSECSVILGLKEYLGVEDEYIIMLAAYCVKKGKKAVKYIEKTAMSLYERDIETVPQLEEYVRWLETKDELENKLRRLIGAGDRSFTKKEKECIERWGKTYSFGFEMIEHAYGKTVGAIGKPSVPYMDKILSSWNEKGYRTVEEVDAGETGISRDGGSFETDDFFRMAVKRGLDGKNNEN